MPYGFAALCQCGGITGELIFKVAELVSAVVVAVKAVLVIGLGVIKSNSFHIGLLIKYTVIV